MEHSNVYKPAVVYPDRNEVGGKVAAIESARWLPVLTILAVGAFYLLTIRAGHKWGDDFSLYIMHARNIAEGSDYRPAAYLHYPSYLGPDAYPPVFPLLLAPVFWLFGLNLTAMKAVVVVTFLAALLVFWRMLKKEMSPGWQAALIAAIGFCPYFWDQKDRLTSDLPFLVFAYLGILLVNKAYQADEKNGGKWLLALVTGLVFYLAYGTRGLGLLLVPSLLLFDLIRNRRLTPSRFAIAVTVLTAGLVVAQSRLLHSEHGYYDHLATSFQESAGAWLSYISNNLIGFGMALAEIWDNGYNRFGRLALFRAMTVLMAVGYLARARKGLAYAEIFAAIYLLAVCVVPMDGGGRYLIPMIPLFVFYARQGLVALPVGTAARNSIAAALGIALLVSYGARYTKLDLKNFPDGIARAESVEFFDYVNHRTQPSDVFIFTKPRALALFTERKSSFYPPSLDDKRLWEYFRRINASHIVVGPKGISPEEQEFLTAFVGKYSASLSEEFSNGDFTSYRILEIPEATGRTNYRRTRLTDPLPQE